MRERYIGLMSGTSMDGIDLASILIDETDAMEVEAHFSAPFSAEVRAELLDLIARPQIAPGRVIATATALGELYAEVINQFLAEHGIDRADVRAIGKHGITWYHLPDGETALGRHCAGTCQIGDPFVTAAHTGIPVISDFRRADMALGGQGAPLAAYFDRFLFAHAEERRIMLNLGGIANFTLLDPGGPMTAFDTGPANMIIDSIMSRHPTEPTAYDAGGRTAARGKVDRQLLDDCLKHPYFQRKPPKTTGREDFGEHYTQRFLQSGLSFDDMVATATALTVETVTDAVVETLNGEFRTGDTVIVSGGGVHNQTIMKALAENLPRVRVAPMNAYGLDPDAKEAVLTALLARAYVHRLPGNVPEVTGASGQAILGSEARVI
ncbi:MAG: anhydro-N-acetylmuramic acid kinase [Acidobacteriota bacterium]|nr:anhydro-N-acetylmuramic acid kinase [Acidobacteriota bacterium]